MLPVAYVPFCRDHAGIKSHWLRHLETNVGVLCHGKDIAPFLERSGFIGSGHNPVRPVQFNRPTQRDLGSGAPSGKDPANVAAQCDVWEAVEPRVNYDSGRGCLSPCLQGFLGTPDVKPTSLACT